MTNPTQPTDLTPPQTREYWYRICLAGMFSSMPTYNAIRVVDHCIKVPKHPHPTNPRIIPPHSLAQNLDTSLPTLPLPERLRLAAIHHIRTIAFRGMVQRGITGCPFPEWLECIFEAQTQQGKWKEWGAITKNWDLKLTEGGVFYMNIAMGKMGVGGVSELVGGVWVPVEADYWEKNMQPQLLVHVRVQGAMQIPGAVQIPGVAERVEGETNSIVV